MLVLTRNRFWCVFALLVAALRMGESQRAERSKPNSIKAALLGEPTPATNRSATLQPGITKKGNILAQVISSFSFDLHTYYCSYDLIVTTFGVDIGNNLLF